MSVIRIKHQKNFVTIQSNTVLSDKKLSWKAKGIWAYCMTRPDDWVFHVSQLISMSEDGQRSVYGGLKELEDNGYLFRKRVREGNKICGIEYVIYETKQSLIENPSTSDCEQQLQNVDVENVDQQNPPLLNIDVLPIIDVNDMSVIAANAGDFLKAGLENKILKKGFGGKEIICSFEELIKFSLNEKMDWGTDEMRKAWGILEGYEGIVTDYIQFIAGIIRNFRKKKQSKYLSENKKGKECKNYSNKPAELPKQETPKSTSGKKINLGAALEELECRNSTSMKIPPIKS